MSWETLEKKLKEEGGGRFLKLKDGEKVVGVFVGEPVTLYKKYQDKTEYSEWAPDRNFKFKLNFLIKENGVWVAKIFEQGKTVLHSIVAVKNKYGLECLFEISRKGSGKDDTVYHILFEEKLSPGAKEEIKKVKLNDLKAPSREAEGSEFDDEFPPAQEPPEWVKEVFTK